jgi:2,3-bisphosphoglycerate-independent phosphoglycerate mutase
MDRFSLSPENQESLEELMRNLQEEIIPKYNYLLQINFPNEQELEEMKGLKEVLELTKNIIDSYADILQTNLLQTGKDIFINTKADEEKGNEDAIMVNEMLKDSYTVMMEEELNEQSN